MLFQALPCPANCSALFGTPDWARVFTTAPPSNPCHPHPASSPPPQSHNNQTPRQSLSPFSTVISLIVTLPGSFLTAKSGTCPSKCQILGSSKRATTYCARLKANSVPSQYIPIILTTLIFHQGFSTKQSHISSSIN